MRRYLVVANQTLAADQLERKVRECLAAGPCAFSIVVPATPPKEHLTWIEGDAVSIARERLDRAIAWFRAIGADVDGTVGDARPMLAIGDTLREQPFDEVILSTLPAGVSRWLRMDLPSRVRASFGLPVSHVVSPPERTASRT
jgi:hypothetical protein